MTFSDLLQIYKNLTLQLIQSHSKIARTLNKYFYKMNFNIIFPVCVNVSETLFVMTPRKYALPFSFFGRVKEFVKVRAPL
jgi:hypothetical protein